MPEPPRGDPKGGLPPWAPYPDPLPQFVPTRVKWLTPPETAPEARWGALDGWAVPGPILTRLAIWGEARRQALFGPVERVGVYQFDIGPRIVVQCKAVVLVLLPDAPDPEWRVQTVKPLELAAQVRAAPQLGGIPGAPAVT